MILFCFHSAHSIMKYIQTLLTFWSAVGFGPIFDCDIKTNNQTCKKQIKSEILLTRNLYLYVPSTISRIWCNSKTASHAMLLQWYMIIYVFPVFCKYWLISEIYLLLLLLLLLLLYHQLKNQHIPSLQQFISQKGMLQRNYK